jgi:4-alpha-glucanotransferase
MAQGSVASLSVVPLQDVLGLGSEGRLNVPSVKDGNYRWRFQRGALKPELARRLASLAEVTDRLPSPVTLLPHEDVVA